jgi:integrase
MLVRLKGLNSVTKTLADGTEQTYWYAWKGGPRLTGEPGTPEFTAAYNEATAKKPVDDETLQTVIDYFQTTTEFTLGIGDRTRRDYIKQIKVIEQRFSDFPKKALADKRTRGIFMEWRDGLAAKSVRQADYAWTVLARILSVALKRGKIDANPCAGGEYLYQSNRIDKIWTFEDEEAFLRSAPAHLHLPLLLALWTGQRQGDLLRLAWSAYDGSMIRLRPSKTISRKRPRGKTVIIPVGVLQQDGKPIVSPLKAALDAAAMVKTSPVILLTTTGTPWTQDGFRASFNKARIDAGITGLTFHDLRGTAVTRLALMGAEVPEIAAITGHSLKDVAAILDAHYLHRDPQLAWNAIRKLEMGIANRTISGTDSPNYAPNCANRVSGEHS